MAEKHMDQHTSSSSNAAAQDSEEELVGIEDVGGDGDDMCFEALKKVKVGYRGIFT